MADRKDEYIVLLQKQLTASRQNERRLSEDNDTLLKFLGALIEEAKTPVVINLDEIKSRKVPEFDLSENISGDIIIRPTRRRCKTDV